MSSIDQAIAETVRQVVREEIRAALEEQRATVTEFPADAGADEDELSLSECARVSGYKAGTLLRWIHDNKLPAKKGAKEWRVRRGDLKVKIGKSSGPPSVVDIRAKVDKMLAGRSRP